MRRPVDKVAPTDLRRCDKTDLYQGTYPIWVCRNQTTHESGYCFKCRAQNRSKQA